jgi:hypothetical protein
MMALLTGGTMKFLNRLFFLLLLGLLVSCGNRSTSSPSKANDLGDGGFLSKDPCGPPCFWNIVPDITTDVQAKKIIQEHIDIHDCEQWPKNDRDKAINCGPLALQFTEFHKVANIAFSPAQKITIGDVVQEYGEPDAVVVDVFKAGYSNLGDKTTVWMDVYFDDIKTIIHMLEQEGEIYSVEEDSPIGGFAYVGQDKWGGYRLLAKPWTGFHLYEGETVSPNP